MTPAILLALLLQAASQTESNPLPGARKSFEILRVPGDGKLRPFRIGTDDPAILKGVNR